MDLTPSSVTNKPSSLITEAMTLAKLKEALAEIEEVEDLVNAISGPHSEQFVVEATQKMMMVVPQIKVLATSLHAHSPACVPLVEELKLRAKAVSLLFTTRSEQFRFSSLTVSPSQDPAVPQAHEAKHKQQKEEVEKQPTSKQDLPPLDEKEAKRQQNLAMFERAIKNNKAKPNEDQVKSGRIAKGKEKRKSIGMEFASVEFAAKKVPTESKKKKPPPFDASQEFFQKGKLQTHRIMAEGFYDTCPANRVCTRLRPLADLGSEKPPFETSLPEIIVVNRASDPRLQTMVFEVESLCNHIPNIDLKTKILALFVSNSMGGSQQTHSINNLSALWRSYVSNYRKENATNVISIGSISHGLLRHRAILFKYLADHLKIPSELVASELLPGLYWNIVELNKRRCLVDVMHQPASLYSENSAQYHKYTYSNVKLSDLAGLTVDTHDSLAQYSIPASENSVTLRGQNSKSFRWVNSHNFSRGQPTMISKLGTGGFGSVWKCKLAGFVCAVKIVNTDGMTKQAKKRALQELAILQKLEHRNIVAYLGQEVREKELYIFMEIVPHSIYELIQHVKCKKRDMFTPEEIITCISHIAKGLMYLHSLPEKIIHRDIKSKNVLVELDDNSGEVQVAKLCDFGVSKVITDNTQADTSIGTSRWMAPEVVETVEGKRKAYDEKADIWALGMVLYEMLTLRLPYEEVGLFDVRAHVLDGHLPALPSSVWSNECRPLADLFKQCTCYAPQDRPSAEQVLLYLLRL